MRLGKGSVVCRGFASPAALRPHFQTRIRHARNTKAHREVSRGLCHPLSRIPNTRFKELSTPTKRDLNRQTRSTRTLPVFMILIVAFWLGDHTAASHTHGGLKPPTYSRMYAVSSRIVRCITPRMRFSLRSYNCPGKMNRGARRSAN